MDAATNATTPNPTDKVPHQARGALDRELFCPRLQRLLMGAASELGQRGNLAQVVASIERGGVGGAGEDPNLGMLRRLGATDTRGIDNRVGQLRELGQRWHTLERKQQGTALALYLGISRAHPTLREHFGEGQGGLAGVVLYRWQIRQSKGRARDAAGSAAKVAVALEAVRTELLPLEAEIAESAYRHFELEESVQPLRAEQARLCAQQAALAATGDTVDDELALVKLCRGGLTKEGKAEMLRGAEAEVRTLHRAWYATGKQATKAWVEGEDAESAA